MSDEFPDLECEMCESTAKAVGVGSASGRPLYRCTNSGCRHEWWGKHPGAQAMGRLGGKARMESLTPEERRELARKGVEARLQKKQHPPQ